MEKHLLLGFKSFSIWVPLCVWVNQKALVLVCVSLFASGVYGQTDDAQRRAQLKELRETMEQLQRELEATKSSRDELQKTLEKSEREASELNKRAKSLERKLNSEQDKLEELEDERSELIQKKKSQQQRVGQEINAAYRAGQQSEIRLLLNQDDPAKLSRNLKYYQYLISARQDRIESYGQTIDRLNTIEPEILAQRATLKGSVKTLYAKRAALTKVQAKRQATLRELNADLSSQSKQLEKAKLDRDRLSKILQQVTSLLQDAESLSQDQPFHKMKGRLPWPTQGRIAQSYGSPRVTRQITWQGWLIQSQAGTPVRAVHRGQVVFSDYLRGHGLLVIVDHGRDYLSLYAHNEAIYKELGEWVEQGETIASVGDSGGMSDHALYFELRHKGKALNPKYWLTKSA